MSSDSPVQGDQEWRANGGEMRSAHLNSGPRSTRLDLDLAEILNRRGAQGRRFGFDLSWWEIKLFFRPFLGDASSDTNTYPDNSVATDDRPRTLAASCLPAFLVDIPTRHGWFARVRPAQTLHQPTLHASLATRPLGKRKNPERDKIHKWNECENHPPSTIASLVQYFGNRHTDQDEEYKWHHDRHQPKPL